MQSLEEIRKFHKQHPDIICGPAKALMKSATSVRDFYDRLAFPAFFTIRLARTNPKEVYAMLIHALGKMPADNLKADLDAARSALLDPNTTEADLERHFEIMSHPAKPAQPHQYYRLVYYLLKWRLGKAPDTNLIAVQEKMQEQLHRYGVPGHLKVLMGWFREAMPFEKWVTL